LALLNFGTDMLRPPAECCYATDE